MFKNSMQGFPFREHAPYLKEFFLINAGFHISSFIRHFSDFRKNDFVEMGLHHLSGMFLLITAYLMNLIEGGVIIIFLHDIPDILTNLVKTAAETRFTFLTAGLFLNLMIIWAYTRIYLLSMFICELYSLGESIDFRSPIVMPFFCY